MCYYNVKTSSNAIGGILYHGTYETIIGEYLGCVTPDNYNEANDEIGKLYISYLTDVFADMFPRCPEDFDLTYEETYHPRYYNFETDNIIFNMKYSFDIRSLIFDYAWMNRNSFEKFLRNNYTSHSGFVSFTPNNFDDWREGFSEHDDWRCVSAAIRFMIEQELTESEMEDYYYDFVESVINMIEEKYIPYEYAAKFDNGMIGIITEDYDENEDATVYNAILVDNCGHIINTARILDEYDEDFRMSAYAAWEWSDIVYDLTNKYNLCGTHNVQCAIPNNIARQ